MSSISSLSSSSGYLPTASSQSTNAQRRSDFQQIVQDLQNNDLSGAQQALARLKQAHHGGGHHYGGAAMQAAADTTSDNNDPLIVAAASASAPAGSIIDTSA